MTTQLNALNLTFYWIARQKERVSHWRRGKRRDVAVRELQGRLNSLHRELRRMTGV